METDNTGTSWLRDRWNNFKNTISKVWDVAVGIVVSAVLVTVGTILLATPAYSIGSGLIGAGIGGFVSGFISKQSGGSFWAGYLGGAISTGLTAFGMSFGPAGAFLGGLFGNALGNLITDTINGVYMDNNYILNLFADSILAGLVSIGAFKFGKVAKILKEADNLDLFIGVTIWAELANPIFFDSVKKVVRNIVVNLKKIF